MSWVLKSTLEIERLPKAELLAIFQEHFKRVSGPTGVTKAELVRLLVDEKVRIADRSFWDADAARMMAGQPKENGPCGITAAECNAWLAILPLPPFAGEEIA